MLGVERQTPIFRQRARTPLKQLERNRNYRHNQFCCPCLNLQAEGLRHHAAQQVLANILSRAAGDISEQYDRRLLQAIQIDERLQKAPHGWEALERQFRRQRDVASTSASILDRALAKQPILVPDVEHAQENAELAVCRCCLTLQPNGRRFRDSSVNSFLASLFKAIASSTLSSVSLNRFDLFHGHLFVTRERPARLGILFHAMEYPSLGPQFEINLGFCQSGSPLAFSQQAFDCRNWLFIEDHLVCLNVGEGSVLHDVLLMDGLQPVRTILETDFGQPLADVNYFDSLPCTNPSDRLFLCLYGGR